MLTFMLNCTWSLLNRDNNNNKCVLDVPGSARRIWWSGRSPSRSRSAWGGCRARWAATWCTSSSPWFSVGGATREDGVAGGAWGKASPRRPAHLLLALLAVVGVAALQHLAPHKLVQWDLQALARRHAQVQRHEGLLTLVPGGTMMKMKRKKRRKEGEEGGKKKREENKKGKKRLENMREEGRN